MRWRGGKEVGERRRVRDSGRQGYGRLGRLGYLPHSRILTYEYSITLTPTPTPTPPTPPTPTPTLIRAGLGKMGYWPCIQISPEDWEIFSFQGKLLDEDEALTAEAFDVAMRFQVVLIVGLVVGLAGGLSPAVVQVLL